MAFSAVFPSKPFIHLTILVSLMSQEEVAFTGTPTPFLPVLLESWQIRKHLYRPDTEIFPSIFQSNYEPEMKTDLPYRKLSPWRLHSCFPPSTVAEHTCEKHLVLFQKSFKPTFSSFWVKYFQGNKEKRKKMDWRLASRYKTLNINNTLRKWGEKRTLMS